MTTLEKFLAADKKVTELENNGGIWINGYATETSKEYDEALECSLKLYNELLEQGINPFE